MNAAKSLRIVRSLAEGIDPFSGEVLEPGHVCQHPDTVRALFHAATELERIAAREQRLERARLTLPPNTGKPWSVDEDRLLLARFRNGVRVDDMAAIHLRTSAAIKARLEKLGQNVDDPAAGQPRN